MTKKEETIKSETTAEKNETKVEEITPNSPEEKIKLLEIYSKFFE